MPLFLITAQIEPEIDPLPFRVWRRSECDERRTLVDRLSGSDVDRLDDPRPRRAQLVLHLHRLDDHEPRTRLDALPHRYLDPDDQSRHRRLNDPAPRRGLATAGERLDLARAIVHRLDLEALAHGTERPAQRRRPVQALRGDGPRMAREQEVVQRRSRHRRQVGLERLAIYGHAAATDVDLVGAGTECHEVLHAASITTTVSTCAVCGNRSNARTAAS